MGDEQISMARGNRGSYMNGMRADWNVNMKNQVKKTWEDYWKGALQSQVQLGTRVLPCNPSKTTQTQAQITLSGKNRLVTSIQTQLPQTPDSN